MDQLPPRPDIDQLRRTAKERLRSARAGDIGAANWIGEVGSGLTLSAAQLRLARDYGFTSWPNLHVEVERRLLLDLRDADALSAFVESHPGLATADLQNWRDHPRGASPLGYLAMARFDTSTGSWGDVIGSGRAAQVLIAAGAPVDGAPSDPETPLITAASYGDADIAAVLIAAGADVDATARDDAGGVPGGTALLHASVFGMTDVVDLLVEAGATIGSIEQAAAAGSLDGWKLSEADGQTKLRALVMAADHQRIDVIEALVLAGTPVDDSDEAFGRHPLRLASANGRPASVRSLLDHGASVSRRDEHGLTALDHCRQRRAVAADTSDYDVIEALLTQS